MIYGNIGNLCDYPFLPEAVKKCFAFAKENDLTVFAKGKHIIDGNALFVNIAEYNTSEASSRIWEAHRQYLDLHLMLIGQEQIDVNHIQNMSIEPYQETRDYVPMTGECASSSILKPGDFLICCPTDGHRTGIMIDAPEAIKKAIFKIRID